MNSQLFPSLVEISIYIGVVERNWVIYRSETEVTLWCGVLSFSNLTKVVKLSNSYVKSNKLAWRGHMGIFCLNVISLT